MLVITITETTLFFEGLTDEEYDDIKSRFPKMQVEEYRNKPTYSIIGSASDLYKVLLNLSFTYDIEVK